MESIRLHLADDGTVWLFGACVVCGATERHRLTDVMRFMTFCGSCGRELAIKGATIESASAAAPAIPVGDAIATRATIGLRARYYRDFD